MRKSFPAHRLQPQTVLHTTVSSCSSPCCSTKHCITAGDSLSLFSLKLFDHLPRKSLGKEERKIRKRMKKCPVINASSFFPFQTRTRGDDAPECAGSASGIVEYCGMYTLRNFSERFGKLLCTTLDDRNTTEPRAAVIVTEACPSWGRISRVPLS